jgi:heme o synthase
VPSVASRRQEPRSRRGEMTVISRSLRTLGAYVALTKPRIIELLLVTTLPTMVLAADGLPGIGLVAITLIGGTLAAGSANALNSYLDRDIDALMVRTAHRPLAEHRVPERHALVFGLILGVVAITWMALLTNPLSAILTFSAIAFYVVIYTMLLKRRTSSNIVWGGAAGCFPILIGWSAVTGSLSVAPLLLFLVVFFWTPPHYWPLAIQYRDDYARAGVPMLPVVADDQSVARHVVAYSWLMVGATLALIPLTQLGWIYISVAVICGSLFLAEAYALQHRARREQDLRPMRLFHGSISYLALIFLVIAVDVLL